MTGLATQLAELATLLSRTLASGVCQSTIVPVTSGAPPVSQAIRLPTETAEVSQSVMTAERGEKRQRLDMAPLEQRATEEPEIISLADQESVASGRDSRSVEMDWPRRQMRPLASMARPRPGKGPYGASGQAAQLARLLKAPPQFDGLAIHLEDWMTAFESYAGGIRMPEYMRVPSACSYLLPATLRQLGLAVVATRPATFTELKRFLLAYYFGADQSERYVTEALDATQKPSESLEAYAARLKELIRLANQTAECVPLALEIQLFIKGLRDVHTKRGMTFLRADDLDRMKRGKQPRLATYEQCVVVARKHEASDPIREGTVNAAAVASTSGTMPVCAVATTSKTKEQLVAEAHEVLRVHGTEPTPQKTMTAKKAPKPAVEKESVKVAAVAAKSDNRTERSSKNFTHMTCFNCEKKGHSASECTQPRNPERLQAGIEKMRERRNEKKTEEMAKMVDAVVGRLTSNPSMEAAKAASGK